MFNLYIVLAILVFLAWGLGDVVNLKFSKQAGARQAAFLSWGGSLGIGLLGFAVAPPWPDVWVVAVSAALGVLLGLCWVGFTSALESGKGSVVCTIAGSFVAVTLVMSTLFLGEKLSVLQIVAVIFTVLGVCVASVDLADIRDGVRMDRSVKLALAVTFGWGVYYAFIKAPVDAAGWFWPSIIAETTGFLPIIWFARKELRNSLRRSNFRLGLIVALLTGGGTYVYNMALQGAGSTLVAAIAGSFPVLTVAVAAIAFKEKVKPLQIFGIIMALTAIVFLAWYS